MTLIKPRRPHGPISARASAKEAPATHSLLDKSIVDIIDISDSERNILSISFENLTFSVLDFSTEEWNRLGQFCIYPEDILDNILALSVSYIYKLWPSEPQFNQAVGSIISLIAEVLNKNIVLNIDNIGSKDKIYTDVSYYIPKGLFISPLFVPRDIVDKLSHFGIYKWDDILDLTEREVLMRYGFSGRCIELFVLFESIYPWVKKILNLTKHLDYSSPEYFSLESILRNWVSKRSKSTRDVKVVLERMGWCGDDPQTLESVGQQNGLTRERVRQIESKYIQKLKHQQALDAIYPLWVVIDSVLHECSGILSLPEMTKKLQVLFKSFRSFSESGMNNIFLFAPENLFQQKTVDDKKYILSKNFVCKDCDKVEKQLLDFILAHEEAYIDEAADTVSDFCRKNCQHENKPYFKPSASLIDYTIASSEQLKKIIRKKDGKLYHSDRWNLLSGRLLPAAESILKQNKRAMHFTEIYEEIKKSRPEYFSISDHNIHAAMDRSQNVLLWDRGTFIHKENVVFSYGLLRQVEKWAEEKLRQDVPFISVHGAFEAFKEKCIEDGIPSESALYSCLRLSGDQLFSYPRYPYIYLNTGDIQKIPITKAIEEFIREAEGVVALDIIKQYALENLYIQDYAFNQHLARILDVFRTNNGYIHADYLNIEKQKLLEVIAYIKGLISKTKHVSVVKIFKEKRVTCALMGVDSPELLFSVLQLYASDEFEARNYPQIRSISWIDTKRKGVLDNIIEYIRKKQSFCTRQELLEHFVKGLGYTEQLVYLAGLKEGVYQYLEQCLVHKDTIKWNDEKQNQIENIALLYYENEVKAGRCYGLIELITESSSLPELGNNLYWTELLIADILTKGNNFKILGNKKNVYVPIPNMFNIESFEHLLFEILKCEHKGAENLDLFSENLVDLGIIKKKITQGMLGNSDKVCIVGQEIILTESMNNA